MKHDHHAAFKDFLANKGLKYTSQRKSVVDEIFDDHDHFEVEELVSKVRSQSNKVARATVYSTIKLLLEANLVRKIRLSNHEVRYEHIFGHDHHDHLICVNCNRMVEVHDETIEKLQEKLCDKYGFELDRHVHTMYVKCKDYKTKGSCKYFKKDK